METAVFKFESKLSKFNYDYETFIAIYRAGLFFLKTF